MSGSTSSEQRGGTLGQEPAASKDDVILITGPEGALSLEFVPLRDGVARAYLRFSPRNLALSAESADKLSRALAERPYNRILVQDSKKKVLRKALEPLGWGVDRAIPEKLRRPCSSASTYDLPLDENLIDINGQKPDLANTYDLHGIGIAVDGRPAWAFYTDDGETARIISEGERKQGLLVASRTEDLLEVASCLVSILAAGKKAWAVFSMDMGRFVREYDPITLQRLSLDSPRPFDHKCELLSNDNKKTALRLFSEYYDESILQSMLRLRRFRIAGNYQIYLVDGGFTITRLEGDSGLIYDIYVTPAKQGQRLGLELMKCALTSLAGKVATVYLHTNYPRAKRLYEKFGFKVVYSQLGVKLDELALIPPKQLQSR